MKRSGRMNPIVVVGILCILIVVPLFIVSRRGPENYASDFMTALGTGDVNRLADITVIGNHNLEERKALWQKCLDSAKYFTFTWRITDVSELSNDRAAVKIMERRVLQLKMGEDEEPHMLTLVKTPDGWKVLVDGMDRDIFPFLPRP